ncbi:MAG: preprotein translocase subunit SecY [Candidatus Paceibacterota bacterium]
MLQIFFVKLKTIVRDTSLRRRIGFVLLALILFRVLAVIPIPGIDVERLASFLSNNQFFGLLNIFSGGGLSNLSIVMLGVAPYITASIIMQLSTIMSPRLKSLYHEEGEAGKKKFSLYSRLLTVPLAVVQGFGLLTLLANQGILGELTAFETITNVVVITAGSLLLMWIGELISEFGIGNGVSIIIFAGIVASLPTILAQLLFSFDVSQIPLYLTFTAAALAIVAGVVAVTEAERPIPITYAKQTRAGKASGGISTYLPLRVNQAGVIPIIFALSILLFPQMVANIFASGSGIMSAVSNGISAIFSNPFLYAGTYFVLVFFFTYFYTAVTFDPEQVATNLQKSGAFIPGVRPGKTTALYISKVSSRITLISASFLGLVAVLPIAMQGVTNVAAFAIGGTALLIVVSVVLDVVKKTDAQLTMREY